MNGAGPDLLDALLPGLAEGVLQTDADGRVVRMNPAAARLTGFAAEEGVGRPLSEVLPVTEEWTGEPALLSAQPEVDGRLRARGGELRLVRIRRRPLSAGELLILEDRTQDRKRAHRLAYADRLANGGALAAARLIGVPGQLQALRLGRADEVAQRLADVSRRVDDALQLLGEPAAAHPTDVGEVAQWAMASLVRPLGVSVCVDVPGDVRVTLAAVALRQVVMNLLHNAVRAVGSSGAVSLEARDVGGVVEIRVTDDGLGPSSGAELPFQPYYTTVPGALGLGLSVVRDLVQGVGGAVTLTRTEPASTCVTVRLPAAEAPTVVRRLLVVDSEPPVLRLLARVLHDSGVQVVGVTGGDAALARLRGGERFDAVLCGVDLPDMDGVELCGRLTRLDPSLAGHLGLLAGSADRLDDLRRRLPGRTPGHGLVKPFDPQQVRSLVTALLAS